MVVAGRLRFGQPGHGRLRPLDAALNLPPTLSSLPLVKLTAEQVTQGGIVDSYEAHGKGLPQPSVFAGA